MNHDRLMARMAQRIGDKRMLELARAFMTAGVMEGGLVSPADEWTPQGGPLSALVSNIVLDDLGQELERRGLRFARHADDCAPRRRAGRAEALRAAVPRKRWGEALRSRRAGGVCKPPAAAALERRGGERVRKRRDIDLVRCGSRSRTQVNRS